MSSGQKVEIPNGELRVEYIAKRWKEGASAGVIAGEIKAMYADSKVNKAGLKEPKSLANMVYQTTQTYPDNGTRGNGGGGGGRQIVLPNGQGRADYIRERLIAGATRSVIVAEVNKMLEEANAERYIQYQVVQGIYKKLVDDGTIEAHEPQNTAKAA